MAASGITMSLLSVLACACLGVAAATLHLPLRLTETGAGGGYSSPEWGSDAPSSVAITSRMHGQMFTASISVGTPPQNMTAIFDLLVGFTWVPSVNCHTVFCRLANTYDSADSSTYQADGRPFSINGLYNFSGILSYDTLSIGDSLHVPSQSLSEVLVITEPALATGLPYDCALGLARRNNQTDPGTGTDTLLDNMFAQGVILERQFSLWLARDGTFGELTFGGVDEARYTGNISWVELLGDDPGTWIFGVDSIYLATSPVVEWCPEGCQLRMDTSTRYGRVSPSLALAVNTALGGEEVAPGLFAIDCSTLDTLPTLRLNLGGQEVEMNPRDYVDVLDNGTGAAFCMSGFIGKEELADNQIFLGFQFMQAFYSVYDAENARIGLAYSITRC